MKTCGGETGWGGSLCGGTTGLESARVEQAASRMLPRVPGAETQCGGAGAGVLGCEGAAGGQAAVKLGTAEPRGP